MIFPRATTDCGGLHGSKQQGHKQLEVDYRLKIAIILGCRQKYLLLNNSAL